MLPDIVSETEWRTAHAAVLAQEKAQTRARDALAAERRRLPMTPFPSDFTFQGPDGEASFVDLFEGRTQLLVYHFWFPEDGTPCGGCTMFSDQVSELAHLHARDVTFAVVSRAPQSQIGPYKARMGVALPVVHGQPRVPGGVRHDGVLQAPVLPALRRRRPPHLRDDEPWRRGAGQRLDVPRPDAVRPPGELGGLPTRPPAGAAVSVVAQEGRVRLGMIARGSGHPVFGLLQNAQPGHARHCTREVPARAASAVSPARSLTVSTV